MAIDSYSGPTEKYNGVPVKALRFYQLKEGQEVRMGEMKMVVDDVKSVITHFLNLYNNIPSINGETFQLNGTTVEQSLIANFVDTASITWTLTYDPVTGAMDIEGTASGGGTPAGSTTQVQYNNAGAFGADSGFTRTAVKVTISGDGTGTDGVLHVISGDSVSQYIVLEEESGRLGEVYLTFKGTTGNAAAMGVLFAAGSPDQYIFTDPTATVLMSINIGTGVVTIRDLSGVGTRMVTANATGVLSTAAIPSLSALTDTHIFVGNGSNVATDVAMSGDATLANTGALTIANDAVTYAKMQNVSATDKLLGRITAGSGDVEEVTLDPDGTLAANSDDVVATQKAVKTYVDAQVTFAKSTADQTTTSTSLVDITNVGIAIAANQNIYVKVFLKVGCSATNGARWAVTIPTGCTMFLSHAGTSEATRALAAPQWLTTSGTEGATTNAIINTNMWVVMEGWVYNGSTAGTIQVQGRSINAANTVTIYSGSMITGTII